MLWRTQRTAHGNAGASPQSPCDVSGHQSLAGVSITVGDAPVQGEIAADHGTAQLRTKFTGHSVNPRFRGRHSGQCGVSTKTVLRYTDSILLLKCRGCLAFRRNQHRIKLNRLSSNPCTQVPPSNHTSRQNMPNITGIESPKIVPCFLPSDLHQDVRSTRLSHEDKTSEM